MPTNQNHATQTTCMGRREATMRRQYQTDLPWPQLNDFILEIGKERTPASFIKRAFDCISMLLPFDSALLYLLDDNQKPYEEQLLGMESDWSEAYLNYYSRLENNRFSYLTATPAIIVWDKFDNCEFVREFIQPQRIHSSAIVEFFNSDRWLTGAFSINRKGTHGYTHREKEVLKIIRSHIYNLHANLYASAVLSTRHPRSFHSNEQLTKRESEIVDLLCQGMKPELIGRRLFISLSTVNRHIANIHKKMNVSNRQEMLVRLLNQTPA